jgi:serine/threonine protein kinase
VHRAVDERLDDTVVVKVLAENHSLNPEIRERFIAEGRALRRVASPHVVSVFDIGESDRQQPYLVLEHADRGTLAERVRELRAGGWTASRADVLAVARGLAAAVEAVHAARLVHRDLSPGNVLLRTGPEAPADGAAPRAPGHGSATAVVRPDVTRPAVVRPDERLVVADLGMCKDLARSSGLTVAGGTDGFRPPEQNGPGTVDTRADLWAMSALVRWLAEGGDLPRGLARALRRSLADAPSRRHPDVAAWLADVEAALARPDEVPHGQPPPGAVPTRSPGGSGLRRPVATVALALALGLGLGLGSGWGVATWLTGRPVPSAGTASVAISGPATAVVGAPITLTAQVTGTEHWVWTLPTGAYLADDGTVELTASSPGRSEVVLEARSPDGTQLTAVHRLEVTAPD